MERDSVRHTFVKSQTLLSGIVSVCTTYISMTRPPFSHSCFFLAQLHIINLLTTRITTHRANMGVAWNAAADADLFEAVLAFSPPLTQIPPADRDGIVAFMQRRGHTGASWEGIR